MSHILEFISYLLGPVALIGTAGWLATKLIENRLSREIENYKTKLKAESDAEIENLKSRLQIAAKEREITVNWLHHKRTTAIESLYSALVDLQNAVRVVLGLLSPRNPQDIRKYSSATLNKLQQTYEAYLKAKIFLSPHTCEKIETVLRGIQDPVVTYTVYLGNYDNHELHTLEGVKNHAWKEILDFVPAALSELESDFRKVLGVENG